MTAVLTQLPLRRAIFSLAWPAMTAMMLVNVFNLVDAYWVGQLGTAALGGMTASAFLHWCLHSVGQLVSTGVTAVVARRIGEGRRQLAAQTSGQGLLLALLLGLGVLALGLPLQRPIFAAMRLTPAVQEAAVAYLTPILYGFPLSICWFSVEATFRGSGDTQTPMRILALALLLNTLLDPLLIFGYGPLPRLGIAGAGWATVISHCLGAFLGWRGLRQRQLLWPPLARPSGRLLLLLLRIGAPIALTSLLFSVTYLFLTPFIAAQGSAAVAAIGIGHRVEGLAFFTCLGFSAAAATLVGQHLGAADPDRAARAAWTTAGICAVLLAALSLGFFLAAEPIFAIFSEDPEVIAQGKAYLRIIAIFEVAMALELVLEGGFSGAGNSLPPMLVGVPITALRVPLAYLLTEQLGLGAAGIWWSISGTTALKGAIIALWFLAGRWKLAKV